MHLPAAGGQQFLATPSWRGRVPALQACWEDYGPELELNWVFDLHVFLGVLGDLGEYSFTLPPAAAAELYYLVPLVRAAPVSTSCAGCLCAVCLCAGCCGLLCVCMLCTI